MSIGAVDTRPLCTGCGKVLRTEHQQRLHRLDTASDVAAALSPSGRMSKRAREAVNTGIAERLFGEESGCTGDCQPSAEDIRNTRIAQLRSRIQTLETCCGNRLNTGRQNATTREIARVREELAVLEMEVSNVE